MEKTIPSYHALVKDALIYLLSIGGKATNKEILEAVMRKFDVDEILREKLNYNLGWAKVYAKNMDWLVVKQDDLFGRSTKKLVILR